MLRGQDTVLDEAHLQPQSTQVPPERARSHVCTGGCVGKCVSEYAWAGVDTGKEHGYLQSKMGVASAGQM